MNILTEKLSKENIDAFLRSIHQERQEITLLIQELHDAANSSAAELMQKLNTLNERVKFLALLEKKVEEWNERIHYTPPERGELRKSPNDPNEWEWRVGGWNGISFWILKENNKYFLEGEEHSRAELALMLEREYYTKLADAKKALEEFIEFYLSCHKEAWQEENQ